MSLVRSQVNVHTVGAENFLLRTACSEGKQSFESDVFGLMIVT